MDKRRTLGRKKTIIARAYKGKSELHAVESWVPRKRMIASKKSFPGEVGKDMQRRSSRPPNPQLGGGPRPTLGAQVSLKLLFGYVTIFSSADLFTTDLNCRKKLACDIISECNVILSRRI